MSSLKFCPKCGTPVMPGDAFCVNCGIKLEQRSGAPRDTEPLGGSAASRSTEPLGGTNTFRNTEPLGGTNTSRFLSLGTSSLPSMVTSLGVPSHALSTAQPSSIASNRITACTLFIIRSPF